jgi:hypothetical protein
MCGDPLPLFGEDKRSVYRVEEPSATPDGLETAHTA